MIKMYGEILDRVGIRVKNIQLTAKANDGGLVEFEMDGYMNEHALIESGKILETLYKASHNKQCCDLLDQIDMILALTNDKG